MLLPVSRPDDVETYRWQETSPGRFERHIDGIELFFTKVNAATPQPLEVGVVRGRVTIDHSFDDIHDRLRNAWVTLRYDHPFMATSIVDEKATYQTPSSSDLEEWVQSTLLICNDMDDPVTRLKPNVGASLFPVLENGRANLIIKCPHRYIDGRGMIQLLNNLVRLVVNPRAVTFGDEAKNLSPSLRIAAGVPNPSPEKVRETMQTLDAFFSRPPSHRLKPLDSFNRPGVPIWKIMAFSLKDTEEIVKGAKCNGVTVTHVICASVALATKAIGGDDGPWPNLVPFSLRPYLLSPYDNADLYPVSCWVLQIPVVAELTDLISTAKQIKAGYTPVPGKELAIQAASFDHFYEKIVPGQFDLATMMTPNISSLGVLDSMFTAASIPTIKVSNLQLGIDMVGEGFIGCHAWTFQGRLHISASYHSLRYSEDMVREYLHGVATALGGGLGVELQPTFSR